MKRIFLSLSIFTIIFFIFSDKVYADNLLLNSSFEDVSNEAPNFWTKNVSTATLSTSSTVKTGTESASISKTNNTTGTIYLYQDVDVEHNSYYSLAGWTVKNDSRFNYSLLRISWRDESAEISKTDSSQLTSDLPTFQELKIDSVQAPSSSIKARIELLANISSPNPTNPVLFDDVSFSQVVAPEQPISTPVVTTTIVPTPTPTPTKTLVPTPAKTPTPKPTPSQMANILGEATVDPPRDIAGLALENDTPTFSPTPSSGEESHGKSPYIAGALIVSGLAFIGGSFYMAFKNRKWVVEDKTLI